MREALIVGEKRILGQIIDIVHAYLHVVSASCPCVVVSMKSNISGKLIEGHLENAETQDSSGAGPSSLP